MTTPRGPATLPAAPAGLPFRIDLTLPRYVLGARRVEFVLCVVIGLVLAAYGFSLAEQPDQTIHTSRYGDVDGHLMGWLAVAAGLVLVFVVPISARAQLRDGFAVGADGHGIYLRPNLDRTRVLFLPWSQVAEVCVRRWHGPQLVVRPKDRTIDASFPLPRTPGGGLGGRIGRSIAQRRRTAVLGTNIHVPIPGVDPAELLAGLRYQAAGRAPVEIA